MRCVRCGKDCKYKERPLQKCPGCGGAFAFEPRKGDRFTDQAFQNAIDAVSASGKLRWGVEHLYYEICRRWNFGRRKQWLLGLAITAAVAIFFPGWSKLPGVAVAAACTVWLYRRARRPARIAGSDFDAMWRQWTRTHGQPKGVIVRQPAPAAAIALTAKEADLGDYSFDRAVICDRARTADLLLANNFHFEHNCAVLSIDGYPPGPFAMVRAMLKRNPRLQVYTLHDATPAGCRMALKLSKDPDWFAGPLRITDMGLRPAHAKGYVALLSTPRSATIGAGDGLAPVEAQWLSHNVLELAVFRPEYILKQVFAAMTRKKEKSDSGGDGSGGGGGSEGSVSSDSQAFSGEGGEAGGSGAADSFG